MVRSTSTSDAGVERSGSLRSSLEDAADELRRADPAAIPPEALQQVFAAVVRAYYHKRIAGEDFGPLDAAARISATEVVVAAANMLQAADLDAFELGMWMRQGTL